MVFPLDGMIMDERRVNIPTKMGNYMVIPLIGMLMEEWRVKVTTNMENHLAFGNNGMKMDPESMKNTTQKDSLMVLLPVGMIIVELEKKIMKTDIKMMS